MDLFVKSQIIELFTFLVPGIIIVSLILWVKEGQKAEYRFLLLYYLIAASFYNLLARPLFFLQSGITITAWWHSLLYYVVLPVISGIACIYIFQSGQLRKIAKQIKINARHSIVDAWDYTFSKSINDGKFVIITLDDRQQIFGYLGGKSFISSGKERDLLIERVYELDGEGKWSLAKPYRSIYIKGEQIAFIEMFESDKNGK